MRRRPLHGLTRPVACHVFSSPTGDTFSIADSYGGFSKFGYLEGTTVYEESYGDGGVTWILPLEE